MSDLFSFSFASPALEALLGAVTRYINAKSGGVEFPNTPKNLRSIASYKPAETLDPETEVVEDIRPEPPKLELPKPAPKPASKKEKEATAEVLKEWKSTLDCTPLRYNRARLLVYKNHEDQGLDTPSEMALALALGLEEYQAAIVEALAGFEA